MIFLAPSAWLVYTLFLLSSSSFVFLLLCFVLILFSSIFSRSIVFSFFLLRSAFRHYILERIYCFSLLLCSYIILLLLQFTLCSILGRTCNFSLLLVPIFTLISITTWRSALPSVMFFPPSLLSPHRLRPPLSTSYRCPASFVARGEILCQIRVSVDR